MHTIRGLKSGCRAAAIAVAVLFSSIAAAPARSQEVALSQRVVSGVVVRAAPSTGSARIGLLRPGEEAELVGEVPGWYQVRLQDGRIGYVSRSWTIVIRDAGAGYVMHAIDVGTGLAIFVEGRDFTLLYDAGSNDDTARDEGTRVLAYLKAVRPDLRAIDHLILSHPHKDHVELMADIIEAYEVRNFWDSGRLHPICGYRAVIEAAAVETGLVYDDAPGAPEGERRFPAATCYGRRLNPVIVRLPARERIGPAVVPLGGGASMTFLHADGSHHSSPNENSLVVRLDLGGARVLLMGDAEAGGRRPPTEAPRPDSIEGRLLGCCVPQLRSEIIVAGHHGSMTSSRAAFLDAVRATHFIVSAGPTRYGSVVLPDRVVLDEFARRGTVWRTDPEDARCRSAPVKIGRDADGRPGGCDNIVFSIGVDGRVTGAYARNGD